MSGLAKARVYARKPVLWVFGSSSSVRTWNPRLREAATTLAAMRRQRMQTVKLNVKQKNKLIC